MMIRKSGLFLVVVFMIVLASSVNALTTIGNCSVLDQVGETYVLSGDVVQNLDDDCMVISADRVTLDCDDNLIESRSPFGISIFSSKNYLEIKNCHIKSGSEGFGYSIQLTGDNAFVHDNFLESQTYGMFLEGNNNVIKGNEIGPSVNGITLSNSNNNVITENLIKNSRWRGINMLLSGNNTIENNALVENEKDGIYVYGGTGNIFELNHIENNGENGIYVYGSLRNEFTSNLISNNKKGIYLKSGSDENILIDNHFILNENGIYFTTSKNNRIIGSTISSEGYDVYLESVSKNNVFLDSSYNGEEVYVTFYPFSELIRKWSYRAKIVDSNDEPLEGAIVTIEDKNGILIDLVSDVGGYTETVELIDYINLGGSKEFYSPYTITVDYDGEVLSREDYYAEQTNLEDVLVLESVGAMPAIEFDLSVYPYWDSYWGMTRVVIRFKAFGINNGRSYYHDYSVNDSEGQPYWKPICSRMRRGRCLRTRTFSEGFHDVDFKVVDTLGNEGIKRVEFYV